MIVLNKIYMPIRRYSIDFNVIKQEIKKEYNAVEDFGSIIMLTLNNKKCAISVNSMGKVETFLQDENDISVVRPDIEFIQNVFKKEIHEFQLIK